MTTRMLFAALLLLAPAALGAEAVYEPPAVYLTWTQDPTTTMTVHWHSDEEDPATRNTLLWGAGRAPDEWNAAQGKHEPIPFAEKLRTNRAVHTVELTGLEPAASYTFRIGEDGKAYHFRTMPETMDAPVRFAIGGDTLPMPNFLLLNRQAAAFDPHFAVIGGDIAYGDGRPEFAQRWFAWFDAWKTTMVTPDGYSIPIIAAIGNHEVQEGYYDSGGRVETAPFYFTYFAFPGPPGYATLDFGDYLSLIALDSGHVNPIEGTQTDWLKEQLAARQDRPHVFPLYHVAAFPSYRSFEGGVQTRIRESWQGLFEEHGVRVVFEHHDHTYKRTHGIRGDEIDPKGVYYLGDGAWGVPLRQAVDADERWYLERSESTAHVFRVELDGDNRRFGAVDPNGVVIDAFAINGGEAIEVFETGDDE